MVVLESVVQVAVQVLGVPTVLWRSRKQSTNAEHTCKVGRSSKRSMSACMRSWDDRLQDREYRQSSALLRIEQVDKRVIAYLLLCDFVLNFVDCYCSSVPRAFTLLLRIVSENDPDHVSLLWAFAFKHEQEGTDLYKWYLARGVFLISGERTKNVQHIPQKCQAHQRRQ